MPKVRELIGLPDNLVPVVHNGHLDNSVLRIARGVENLGIRLAAKGIQPPWRWNGGTILPNSDVIWGMSSEIKSAIAPR